MKDLVNQNRSHLTAEESLKKLYEYSYIQDAKQRSYHLRLQRAHAFTFGTVASIAVFYVGYNLIEGVWAKLSTTNQITNLFRIAQNPVRSVYRPEIYLRDQNADQIIAQKTVEQNNPLKLWH
ncbi:unnamed protein product [Paramecium octaurelia]|uniref:Uncharacterized protein n=1 Tax=Paramecium octaurelia TaxID=43137 RepID=A0A8S1TCZ3_PAROT|nr:unnamed protein product [Paramecium octaurelia]